MAKKPKEIVPFFKLRFQIQDTLEALSHEILMCLQAMESVADHGGVNEAAKQILQERTTALRKIVLSEIGES